MTTVPTLAPATDLYEQDFHAWTREQAAHLKAGRWAELDVNNLVEEIEAMGRSERHELVNRLAVLLAHLLKWHHQPERRGKSWRLTIEEQRYRVLDRLTESPSLRHGIDDTLARAYRYAILQVAKETPLEKSDLPPLCSYTLEQILDENYWPESDTQ